jgi:hypothetical protein
LDERSERPGLRHELKLVADEAALGEVRMALRLDRAGIRILYPPRLVQSLYLDTTFQRSLEANLAGLSERSKLRLRWYGASASSVRATLEHKRRENSLGWKESVALTGELDVAGTERHAFLTEVRRRVPAGWNLCLAGLEPAQWVRYQREYFTSADGRVRLTLDRELACFDQRRLARLSARERSATPRVVVLELKCAPEHHDVARAIVGRLPMPLGRCSKFVLAAEPSGGPHASQFTV